MEKVISSPSASVPVKVVRNVAPSGTVIVPSDVTTGILSFKFLTVIVTACSAVFVPSLANTVIE